MPVYICPNCQERIVIIDTGRLAWPSNWKPSAGKRICPKCRAAIREEEE